MTGWIIFGVVFAIMLFVLFVPIGVRVRKQDTIIKGWMVVGFWKWQLYPSRPRKQANTRKPKVDKKPKQAKTVPTTEETPVTPEAKTQRPKSKFQDRFDMKKLVSLGFKTIARLGKLVSIDRLTLQFTAAALSPDKAAIQYGNICAALGALLPFLHQYMKVRKQTIATTIDFTKEQMDVNGEVQITIQLGGVLLFGLSILVGLAKCYHWKANKKEV